MEEENDGLELDLLLSVTTGLGRWEWHDGRRVFIRDDDCIACLKDVARFLRRDDPVYRDAFFKLGELRAAQSLVLPLVAAYPEDQDLLFNALKVLTLLTMQPGATPQEADRYPVQISLLQATKEACLDSDVLGAFMGLAAGPLSRQPGMTREDTQVLQLLLTFWRNLLVIPDAPQQAVVAVKKRATLQEQLVLSMSRESCFDLVVLVAGQAAVGPFAQDGPMLAELLLAALETADVVDVVKVRPAPAPAAGGGGRGADAAAAAAERRHQHQPQPQEQARRKQPLGEAAQRLKALGLTRSSRYAPLLAVHHADGKGGVSYARVTGGASADASTLQPLQPVLHTRVIELASKGTRNPEVLCSLKALATDLLSGPSYNLLMTGLRRDMREGPDLAVRMEGADFERVLRLIAWVTCYVRLSQEELHGSEGAAKPPAAAAAAGGGAGGGAAAGDTGDSAGDAGGAAGEASPEAPSPFGAISATLTWEMLYVVHRMWASEADTSIKMRNWQLLAACSSCLRELLGVLDLAGRAGNAADRGAADRLTRRMLYDDMKETGLLNVLSRLIRGFSAAHQPRSEAGVLVECVHVVCRLYDTLLAREGGKFVVRRKKVAAAWRRRQQQELLEQQEEEEEGGDKEEEGGQEQQGEQAPQQQQHEQGGAEGVQPEQQQQQSAGGRQGQSTSASPAAAEGDDTDAPAAAAGGAAAATACPTRQLQQAAASSQKEQQEQGEQQGSQQAAAASNQKQQEQEEGGQQGSQPAAASSQQQAPSPAAQAAESDAVSEGPRPGGESKAAGGKSKTPGGLGGKVDPLEAMEVRGLVDEEDEEDVVEGEALVKEVSLDLKKRLTKELGNPAVIHFYIWLLQGYDSINSPALNGALMSFLWRLVLPEHLDLEAGLYQLGALALFHKFLSDPALRKRPDAANLLQLATRVVRGLFSRLAPPPPPPPAPPAPPLPPPADAPAADAAAAGSPAARAQGMEPRNIDFRSLLDSDSEKDDAGQRVDQDVDRDVDRQAKEAAAVKDAGEVAREAAELAQKQWEVRAGMLCCELLFWKQDSTCNMIRHNYYLDEQLSAKEAADRAKGKGPKGGRGRGRGRGGAAAAGGCGGSDEEGHYNGMAGTGDYSEDGSADERAQRAAALRPLLNEAGVAKLKGLFEKVAAHRANLDWLVDEIGGGLTKRQVTQELKRLGLAWGKLPPSLAPQLQGLWEQHQGDRKEERYHTIAAALPGGWSAKQVRKLLREAGLEAGRGRRRNQPGDGSGDSGDEGAPAEAPLEGVDPDQLEALYREHLAEDNYLEQIAAALPAELSPTPGAVLSSLRAQGLVPPPPPTQRGGKLRKSGGKSGGGGGGSKRVSKAALAALWEQHRDDPEGVNLVAMATGVSAAEVMRLLVRYRLHVEASSSSGEDADEEAAKKPAKKRRRRSAVADEDGDENGDDVIPGSQRAGATAAAGKSGGKATKQQQQQVAAVAPGVRSGVEVREPAPLQVLGYLEALHREHLESGRWMSGPQAVAWICSRVDTAEQVWADAAAAGYSSSCQDYALVPSGSHDMEFFCSEWSNELLVAAGITSPSTHDYFVVPARGSKAWRDSCRGALRAAEGKLGSEEAEAARKVVMEEAAVVAAAQKAAAAAEAEQLLAQPLAAAAAGRGGGKKGGKGGGGKGGKQRKGKGATAPALLSSEDDLSESELGIGAQPRNGSGRKAASSKKGIRLSSKAAAAAAGAKAKPPLPPPPAAAAGKGASGNPPTAADIAAAAAAATGGGLLDSDLDLEDSMDLQIEEAADEEAAASPDAAVADTAAAAGSGGGSRKRASPVSGDDSDSNDGSPEPAAAGDKRPAKRHQATAAAAAGKAGGGQKRKGGKAGGGSSKGGSSLALLLEVLSDDSDGSDASMGDASDDSGAASSSSGGSGGSGSDGESDPRLPRFEDDDSSSDDGSKSLEDDTGAAADAEPTQQQQHGKGTSSKQKGWKSSGKAGAAVKSSRGGASAAGGASKAGKASKQQVAPGQENQGGGSAARRGHDKPAERVAADARDALAEITRRRQLLQQQQQQQQQQQHQAPLTSKAAAPPPPAVAGRLGKARHTAASEEEELEDEGSLMESGAGGAGEQRGGGVGVGGAAAKARQRAVLFDDDDE